MRASKHSHNRITCKSASVLCVLRGSMQGGKRMIADCTTTSAAFVWQRRSPQRCYTCCVVQDIAKRGTAGRIFSCITSTREGPCFVRSGTTRFAGLCAIVPGQAITVMMFCRADSCMMQRTRSSVNIILQSHYNFNYNDSTLTSALTEQADAVHHHNQQRSIKS